jgi:GTP-binding protein
VLYSSRPQALPDSYVRYLVNSLREIFDLPGVPIRLHLRKGENPYAKGE